MLLGKDYSEYKGLKENYGKYYELNEVLTNEALADYSPEEINDDVIREIIENLDDPYAEYYTAAEYKQFRNRYDSSYVGVGILIADSEEGATIYGVIEEGPADKAGVLAGDIIVAVDGEEVRDSDEATDAISGEAGTEVTITVRRDGENIDYTMKRRRIEGKSVSSTVLDEDAGIGYIKIASFISDTAGDFKLAVKDVKQQGCNKVVIDLRDNGGGLTKQAYELADYLLPECKIVTVVNKQGEETIQNSKASSAGIEYVLLVNGGTASASEIVTAAVQDNKGAKVIGTNTYGKGVTQRTYQFKDGSAIKFTIEEYFRPNGDRVNGVGITPDIIVEDSTGTGRDAVLEAGIEELR